MNVQPKFNDTIISAHEAGRLGIPAFVIANVADWHEVMAGRAESVAARNRHLKISDALGDVAAVLFKRELAA